MSIQIPKRSDVTQPSAPLLLLTPAQHASAIAQASGTMRRWQAFEASVDLMFHALAKEPNRDFDHEAAYFRVAKRCDDAGARPLVSATPTLMAATALGVRSGQDFLGSLVAEFRGLDKSMGQCFTPREVCDLAAELTLDADITRRAIKCKGYVGVHEPAAGSGAMVLRFADRLTTQGVDPTRQLFVEAWEIDPITAKMCFIQLTLRGIPARVVLGDTLIQEEREVWSTAGMWRLARGKIDKKGRRAARHR